MGSIYTKNVIILFIGYIGNRSSTVAQNKSPSEMLEKFGPTIAIDSGANAADSMQQKSLQMTVQDVVSSALNSKNDDSTEGTVVFLFNCIWRIILSTFCLANQTTKALTTSQIPEKYECDSCDLAFSSQVLKVLHKYNCLGEKFTGNESGSGDTQPKANLTASTSFLL